MSTFDTESAMRDDKSESPAVNNFPTRIAQVPTKFFLVTIVFLAISAPFNPGSDFQSRGGGMEGRLLTKESYEAYLPESVDSNLPSIDGRTLHALTTSIDSVRRYHGLVHAAARRYGVDPYLVLGIIKAESNFDTHAVSKRGAVGLMQLMPGTARMHNVANVHDPAQNVRAGVRHLRLLIDRFQGNLQLAIAAYNAGSSAVRKHKDIPPYSETQKYVKRVLAYYRFYRDSDLALLGSE